VARAAAGGVGAHAATFLLLGLLVLAAQLTAVVVLGLLGLGTIDRDDPIRTGLGLVVVLVAAVAAGLVGSLGLLRAALAVVDGEAPSLRLVRGSGRVRLVVAVAAVLAPAIVLGLAALVVPGMLAAYAGQFALIAALDEQPRPSVVACFRASARLAWAQTARLLPLWAGALLALVAMALLGTVTAVGPLLAVLTAVVGAPLVALALTLVWRLGHGRRPALLAP
jgi:hypothetical protein